MVKSTEVSSITVKNVCLAPKFKPTEPYQPEEELDEEQLQDEEYYKSLPDEGYS